MGRNGPARVAAGVVLVLFVAACGGDEASETSTTPGTASTTTTAAVASTTTVPAPTVVARFGDREPVVRALQFLLVCNGYTQTVVDGLDRTLVPDGIYGQITANLVDTVQRDLGFPRHGDTVGPELYLRLADDCDEVRSVYFSETDLEVEAGGVAGPEFTDSWTLQATAGQHLTLTPAERPLVIGITDPAGAALVAPGPTEGIHLDAALSGTHTVTVAQDTLGPYRLTVTMPPLPAAIKLQSDGLDIVDFGASSEVTTGLLTAILGEPTSTTGWTEAGGCLRARRIEWGRGLWIYLTDADTAWGDAGVEHFAVWRAALPASGEEPFPRLETPSGLAVGDTAEQLAEVYGDRAEVTDSEISIVDGIIVGELDAADGTVAWLQAGSELCPPTEEEETEEEEDG